MTILNLAVPPFDPDDESFDRGPWFVFARA
jgi:hypothetical protein